MSNYLRLPHFNSLRPCPWCECNEFETVGDNRMFVDEEPRPWSDFAPSATWRQTLWCERAAPEWHARFPRAHPLFSLPGVSVNTVVPDQLHVCDLGVFGRLMANVAFTAVFDSVEQGPNLQSRMDAFWLRMIKHYEPGKRQIGALTLAMICDDNKPHRKQPVLKQLKGAEARYACVRAGGTRVARDTAYRPLWDL